MTTTIRFTVQLSAEYMMGRHQSIEEAIQLGNNWGIEEGSVRSIYTELSNSYRP